MENSDLLGFLIVTLNCNMTIVGTLWLIVAILLRMLMIILAGSPIYQDEQERFVCNTLQPGCANVCYDLFSPLSPLRFWLVQSLVLLLPSVVFSAYALHRCTWLAARGTWEPRVPDLSAAYLVHLLVRTLLEAALAALHYLLFGFSVPTTVPCSRAPCSGTVDCYVSRPTEKSLLMFFIWAVSALSFLLNVADVLCSLKRRPRGTVWGSKGIVSRSGPEVSAPPAGLPQNPEYWQSQGQQEDGREEEGMPMCPGKWMAGQGRNSPSVKTSAEEQMELPDKNDSDVMSLASNKLAVAHTECGFKSHRGAAQNSRSKSPTKSGEPPWASQSHLPGHCSASQPQATDQLTTSSSTPHLRTKKSEWV